MDKGDYKSYNPDILETIANLSNDEVFTPPKLANDILDLLPEEIWKDSTITFLDPACKTGVFLREIASRLIDGLADEIPDLQTRVNHILTKQVFGIGITELTALMSRRTLYCSMYANGDKSICTEFDDEKGNIAYPQTEHTFNERGRCEICGANKETYDKGAGLENYAYSFIHDDMKEVFKDMKFDVIVGNPPYQLDDGGGSGDSAVPLYNKFIEKAIELNPKYLTMIVPSRWMKGGKGLDSFRNKMINDTRMKIMHDFQSSDNIFSDVQIDGGVCYFLWDSNYNDKVDYTYYGIDGISHNSTRLLKSNNSDTVIRDYRQHSIIKKVNEKDKDNIFFDEIVSVPGPFGFRSFLFKSPERYPDVILNDEYKDGLSLIYGSSGHKGGERISKYINNSSIKRNFESVPKYKLFFPRAMGTNDTVPPKIIKGYPGSLCTETFLKIGDFDTEEEMLNCLSYIETKFFRALLYFNRASLVMASKIFSLIPLQDFSKIWTDEELYNKYELTKEDIGYIEDNIDPMGKNTPDIPDEEIDEFDNAED